MACLSRPYPFKIFKGCLPQNLLSPILILCLIYTSKYKNLKFLGDFNAATCYKNPDKPTCIDLILTNCPRSFQNSCVITDSTIRFS